MQIIKLLLILLMLVAAAGAGFYFARWAPLPVASSAPVVEQVRELSRLTTLEIPLNQVLTARIAGYTGSISAVLVAHGEVVAAVAVDEAKTKHVDEAARRAVIELPPPQLERPRLDHKRTEIYR